MDDLFSSAPPSDQQSAQASPGEPSRSLRIVRAGTAPLGKTQQKFNKLLARIEGLRAERLRAEARWDAALADYVKRIHPLETRLHDLRRGLVRALAEFWRAPKGLGKRQRPLLRDLLLGQYSFLEEREAGPDDEDLRKLRDDLEADALAEAKKARAKDARAGIGRPDFEAADGDDDPDGDDIFEGLDMSKMHPGMSEAEMMEEMARQMFEKGGFGGLGGGGSGFNSGSNAEPKPRKPSAAQLRREQREAELEEARKRGVATIYKQLAKVLHPDLEQDPDRRAEKERLMQELTAAYRAGDLHTLLRLELEFIHREQGDLNHLGEEKLKIYCELLREQVTELERAVYSVAQEPRYGAIRRFLRPFDARPPDWREVEAGMAAQAGSIERSISALKGPDAREEVRGALNAFAAERKRLARRPIFGGFF